MLDTSEIVNVRRMFEVALPDDPGADAVDKVFQGILRLVREGRAAFPDEVVRECGIQSDPTADFVRAAHAERAVPQPSFGTMRRVMAVAGDVVDHRKEKPHVADPWVLAMALELYEAGREVMVVTDDRKDRGSKVGMTTAASRLGLRTCRLFVFLREENLEP